VTTVKEAIGDRFHAVLVDNGVMRLDECRQVKKTLTEHLGINLTIADASQRFVSGLAGVTDPEKKRKFIGNTFIEIFEEEAIKIEKAAENTPNAGRVEWFLQGTLYPVSPFAAHRLLASKPSKPCKRSSLIELLPFEGCH
jgi:GMP synthase (glutamine-hydrolysing)